MHFKYILFLIAFISSILVDAQTTPQNDPSWGTPVWADEFNGTEVDFNTSTTPSTVNGKWHKFGIGNWGDYRDYTDNVCAKEIAPYHRYGFMAKRHQDASVLDLYVDPGPSSSSTKGVVQRVIESPSPETRICRNNGLDFVLIGDDFTPIIYSSKNNNGKFNIVRDRGCQIDGTNGFEEPIFKKVENGTISIFDVDGDEAADILITGLESSAKKTRLYLNDGFGHFEEHSTLVSIPGVEYGSVSFADVDNDADNDFIITGSGDAGYITQLYINVGSGEFVLSSSSFTGVKNSSVAFADIDNDNDQDVLITGETSTGSISKLYTNEGSGNFVLAPSSFTGVKNSSVAFADIDKDNDQDILITGESSTGPISKLYTNEGSGNFVLAPSSFTGVMNSSVAFADIDNDRDQDVLITGEANSVPISLLYLNNGSGGFTNSLSYFTGVKNGSVALAYIDGDDYWDVLITGEGNNGPITKLYLNTTTEAPLGTTVSFVESSTPVGNDEGNNYKFKTATNSSIAVADLDKFVKLPYEASEYLLSTQEFKYGYFEIRCKLPQLSMNESSFGIGANFWLFGINRPSTDENKRKWSEIDIFEFATHKNYVNDIPEYTSHRYSTNAHFRGYNTVAGEYTPKTSDKAVFISDEEFDFTDYHTFGMAWFPNRIEYFVDDELVKVSTFEPSGEKVVTDYYENTPEFNEIIPKMDAQNIIIDMNVYPWNEYIDNSTLLPYEYKIDYVRVYQLDDSMINTPCDACDLNGIQNAVYKKIDFTGGNVNHLTVYNGEDRTFRSVEGVELGPGFYVESGAELFITNSPHFENEMEVKLDFEIP